MEQHPHPPEWIFKILRSFCPAPFQEEIEGDLYQRYVAHAARYGSSKAKRILLWSVIRFVRPGILFRNQFTLHNLSFYMLSNYIKIALRVMARTKAFTTINMSGLVLGITGALLLFLWVAYEFSFEQFHEKRDRIYVAWNRASENNQINCWNSTPRILAPTIKSEISGIAQSASFAQWDSPHLFSVGDRKVLKRNGAFTDGSFLSIVSFPMIAGDVNSALSHPNSIVITEAFAKQLFGNDDALGRSVSISQEDYNFEFIVSGILKDIPSNTQFQFDYLISFLFLESLGEKDESWGNNSLLTLVELSENTDVEQTNEQLRSIVKKHYPDGQHVEIFLHPLTKQRLYSRFENGVQDGGRIDVINMIILLGISLVLIACINFINLSTARAQRRSKEVAVRKVTGAIRRALIFQFLTESILVSAMSAIVALALAFFMLPYFNLLISHSISFTTIDIKFWLWFVVGVLAIGMIAGSYPAFYLSSFLPTKILRGSGTTAGGRSRVRFTLVVAQFGFAITMIVSTIVIYKQIKFVQDRNAGYSKDNLVFIPLTGELPKSYSAFVEELKSIDAAVSVTKTSGPLTMQWSGTTDMKWRDKDPENRTDVERIWVDQHVTTTLGLQVISGRDFDLDKFATDSTAVLINETALRLMEFQDPIGEEITDQGRQWHIIGVVKDFVFTSPHGKIEPIVLFGSKHTWAFNYVYIKLNPSKPIQQGVASVETLAKKYNPDYPVDLTFADSDYDRKFDDMRSTLRITITFCGIAIFIACIGLLGLATYMTEVRRKEIGIRKVMGGSSISIARMMSYATVKPILYSIILFSPLGWLSMEWWLQSFAYRTTIDPWIFIVAALALLTIALVTICVQTISAARLNPVKTLKME